MIEFIKIINDPKGLEIGARHITLSTCGMFLKYEFAELNLQVNLAISLHLRMMKTQYMKINKISPKSIDNSIKVIFKQNEELLLNISFKGNK